MVAKFEDIAESTRAILERLVEFFENQPRIMEDEVVAWAEKIIQAEGNEHIHDAETFKAYAVTAVAGIAMLMIRARQGGTEPTLCLHLKPAENMFERN